MSDPWITQHAQETINEHYDDIAQLRGEVEQHRRLADEARLLALQLSEAVHPLRPMFNGIRSLHTTQTWLGNAATLSRSRLDEHESRAVQAIQQIDALIDDLRDRAHHLEQLRSLGLTEIEDLQWAVYLLQTQLS